MSSLVTAMFKATIGLLTSKCSIVETEKLKVSDITDKSIVREIDEYVTSKLDGLARTDLRTSIGCFKEGIVNLFKLLDNVNSDKSEDDRSLATKTTVGAEEENFKVSLRSSKVATSKGAVTESLTKLKVTDLNELEHKTLFEAKQSFKKSSMNAKDAFNNEALSMPDRIQAMAVRVAATILEKVDSPEEALAECRMCLVKLHSLPDVQRSFSVALDKGISNCNDECREIIYTVCHVNRVIHDVTQMFSKGRELLTWPCIDNVKEKLIRCVTEGLLQSTASHHGHLVTRVKRRTRLRDRGESLQTLRDSSS